MFASSRREETSGVAQGQISAEEFLSPYLSEIDASLRETPDRFGRSAPAEPTGSNLVGKNPSSSEEEMIADV